MAAADNPADNSIHLDDPSLEKMVELYPAELRDPVIWLGRYVREECGRDFDVLVTRANKVGLSFDKTNWVKVLKGRWNYDAKGAPLPSPIIKLEKLIRSIGQLQQDARVKQLSGRIPFIETSTSLAVHNYIDVRRTPDRVCRFGVVIGETGNQKTASFREYCFLNSTCVWLDAPERSSVRQFQADLARCYGITTRLSSERIKFALEQVINDRKTIILENAQRLYDERSGAKQSVFSYIQKLQEESGCVIILSFTPVFEKTSFLNGVAREFFEQFVGRAGGTRKFLRLPAYPPEDDVLDIATALKIKNAEKHLAFLMTIAKSEGRIRVLFNTLQDAKIAAEAAGEALTIEHVKEAWGEE